MQQPAWRKKNSSYFGTCKRKILNNGTKCICAECGLLKIQLKTIAFRSRANLFSKTNNKFCYFICFSICLPRIFSFLSKIFAFGESGSYCYRISFQMIWRPFTPHGIVLISMKSLLSLEIWIHFEQIPSKGCICIGNLGCWWLPRLHIQPMEPIL